MKARYPLKYRMPKNQDRVVVPETVELWTFQPRDFYDHLVQHGVSWEVTPDFDEEDVEPIHNQWPYAFQWLSRKMHERGVKSVKHPPPSYPIWAWFWWYGEQRKHPDLRYHSSRAARGSTGSVLLKLKVPRAYVCITDYTAWHNVLNHAYFSSHQEDDDAFDQLVLHSGHTNPNSLMTLPAGPLRDKLEASWEKVFDINAEPENWWFRPFEERALQATVFAVSIEHVEKAWWLPPIGKGSRQLLYSAKR